MTLKLTPDHVDTWLKTRDGRKVKCVYMGAHDVYTIFYPPHTEFYRVYENGQVDDLNASFRDIIGEWKEPETKEVVVYLCKDIKGELFNSFYNNSDAIASTKVTLTEGVFHDDNR